MKRYLLLALVALGLLALVPQPAEARVHFNVSVGVPGFYLGPDYYSDYYSGYHPGYYDEGGYYGPRYRSYRRGYRPYYYHRYYNQRHYYHHRD